MNNLNATIIRWLATVLLLWLSSGGGGAIAAPFNPAVDPTPVPDTSVAHYVQDLQHDKKSERLYAARVLRSRLRIARRKLERAKPGSLAHDEAIELWDTYEEEVVPTCLEVVDKGTYTPPVVDILGLMENPVAREALETLTQQADSRRVVRKARRALERIAEAADR